MSSDNSNSLNGYTNEELGQLVRNTAAFRAAAACAKFADEAKELQENDSLAFTRLVKETHERQGTNVQKLGTSAEIVKKFIDVVEQHAELADNPADAAENATKQAVEDDG